MVDYEFFDAQPRVDLPEEELMQELKRFAGVDMHQTRDEEVGCQILHERRIDASVLVGRRFFMRKRALGKHFAATGLTKVVIYDGGQYILKHGKVLVG